MKIHRLNKNSTGIKLVTFIVITTILCQNIAWANGKNRIKTYNKPENLATESNIEDIILGAQLMYTGDTAMEALLIRDKKDNREIYREIARLRNNFIVHQGISKGFKERIMWLVFTDRDIPSKKAYYIFTGKGIYFRYTKGGQIVNDNFYEVLKRLGGNALDISPTRIKHKDYTREIWQITNDNLAFINSCLKIIYGDKVIEASTNIPLSQGKGLLKRLQDKLLYFWFPRLDEKCKLAGKIESLGINVKGWKRPPVEYLEDMLFILNNLKSEDRGSVKKITLIPWYRSLLFWLGIGGYALSGKGYVRVVLMPKRATFQWVFAHELGHLVMDRNKNISNRMAEYLWKIKRLKDLSLKERIILGLEFILPLFLAVSFIMPKFGFAIGLLGICLGILVSRFTGGVYYKLNQTISDGKTEVFDCTRPWRFLSLYSLSSKEESEAEGFAASVLYPRIEGSSFSKIHAIVKGTFMKEKVDSEILEDGRKSGRRFPARFFIFLSLIGHIMFLLYFDAPQLFWNFAYLFGYIIFIAILNMPMLFHIFIRAGNWINKIVSPINKSIKEISRAIAYLISKTLFEVQRLLLPVIFLMIIASLSVNTRNTINSYTQEMNERQKDLPIPIELELQKQEGVDAEARGTNPIHKLKRFYRWGEGVPQNYYYDNIESPHPFTPSKARDYNFTGTYHHFIPGIFPHGRRVGPIRIDNVEEFIIHIRDAEPGWCNIGTGYMRTFFLKRVRLRGGPQDIHIPASEIISRLRDSTEISGFNIDFGRYSWMGAGDTPADLNPRTIYLEVESIEVIFNDEPPIPQDKNNGGGRWPWLKKALGEFNWLQAPIEQIFIGLGYIFLYSGLWYLGILILPIFIGLHYIHYLWQPKETRIKPSLKDVLFITFVNLIGLIIGFTYSTPWLMFFISSVIHYGYNEYRSSPKYPMVEIAEISLDFNGKIIGMKGLKEGIALGDIRTSLESAIEKIKAGYSVGVFGPQWRIILTEEINTAEGNKLWLDINVLKDPEQCSQSMARAFLEGISSIVGPANVALAMGIYEDLISATQSGNIPTDVSQEQPVKQTNLSVEKAKIAFQLLSETTNDCTALTKNKSELGGVAQRTNDVTKLKFAVPISVLRNLPDLTLALKKLGLKGEGSIPFELIVYDIETDLEAEGLKRYAMEAFGVSPNISIVTVTKSQLGNKTAVIEKTRALKEIVRVRDNEYLAIATGLTGLEDSGRLKATLEPELSENTSISVIVEPDNNSVISLSAILIDWLKNINNGKLSSINIILPVLISPQELRERLEVQMKYAWELLTAA